MTDTQKVLEDPSRLASLERSGLLDSAPEEELDRFTRLVARIIGAPTALISLVDDRRQFFKSQVGLSEPWASLRETPLSHSYCQHVVASGEPFVVEDAREHHLLNDNPAIATLNAIAYCGVPIVDGRGHTLGSLCVLDDKPRLWSEDDVALLCDIAESVVAGVKLTLMAAELEQANESLRDFIAVASHDIRNPLSVILMNAAALRDGDRPVEDQESLDAIQSEARRATRLVKELTEMSRLEAGLEPATTTVNVANVLESVVSGWEPDAGVKFCSPEDAFVLAEPDHFHRIVSNLVSNAVKYGSAPICVEATTVDACVEVSVSDEGLGVPLAFVPRLFEKFARADEVKTSGTEGTGLGLSIVEKLVEINGGSIRYERNFPTGARFVVTLPRG